MLLKQIIIMSNKVSLWPDIGWDTIIYCNFSAEECPAAAEAAAEVASEAASESGSDAAAEAASEAGAQRGADVGTHHHRGLLHAGAPRHHAGEALGAPLQASWLTSISTIKIIALKRAPVV